MKTGGLTSVTRSKFAATLAGLRGSLNDNTVAARRVVVAVLPTPFAPSIATAASSGSASSSTSSITRRRYSTALIQQMDGFLLSIWTELH